METADDRCEASVIPALALGKLDAAVDITALRQLGEELAFIQGAQVGHGKCLRGCWKRAAAQRRTVASVEIVHEHSDQK